MEEGINNFHGGVFPTPAHNTTVLRAWLQIHCQVQDQGGMVFCLLSGLLVFFNREKSNLERFSPHSHNAIYTPLTMQLKVQRTHAVHLSQLLCFADFFRAVCFMLLFFYSAMCSAS